MSFTRIDAQQFSLDDIPLTWNDFQRAGENITNLNGHTASIYSGYRYHIQFSNKDGKSSIIINSVNYIDYGRSSVLSGFLDKATIDDKRLLLNHEKGHLIINFIYHKILEQAWSSYRFTSWASKEIDSIYDSIWAERNLMNKKYDSETKHGLILSKQKEWIGSLLHKLNEPIIGQNPIRHEFTVEVKAPPLVNKIDDPVHYNYNNNYAIAFAENFDQVKNESFSQQLIGLDTDNTFALIINGIFNIDNTKGNKWWGISMYESIDYSKNFEIELSFKIKQTKKKGYYALALYWGLDSNNNNSNANIRMNASGDGKLTLCHGGDHKDDKSKSFYSQPSLSSNQFTKLNIRKIDSKYYIFINNKFEKEVQCESLSGNGIILGAFGQVSVDYDYLNIFYLNEDLVRR